MQQLVGQAQHPLGIAVDYVDEFPLLVAERLVAGEFLHGSVYQREGSAELVRDVGEEGGALLADLLRKRALLLGKFEFLAVHLRPQVQSHRKIDGRQEQKQIEQQHGPGKPWRRLDPDVLDQFLPAPASVGLQYPDPERVPSSPQAGVSGAERLPRRDPVLLIPLQPVPVCRHDGGIEVLSREIEQQLFGVVLEHERVRDVAQCRRTVDDYSVQEERYLRPA